MDNPVPFFMSPITAKVFRVRSGIPHFAEVEMEMQLIGEQISFVLNGEGFKSQGEIEDASNKGYEHWQTGAVAGIKFALYVMGVQEISVTVNRISGRDGIDTNPWVVGEAAAKGIWNSAEFEPLPELIQALEEFVSSSWHFPETVQPDFLHLANKESK